MRQHDPGGRIRLKLADDVVSEAVFGGEREEFRYVLHRTWRAEGPEEAKAVGFVMMNPSTADVDVDDPTVAKCQRYARRWGYGAMYVWNTFAYRATDQKQLLLVDDPVGPENDRYLLEIAAQCDRIVLAYGKPHAKLRARGEAVQRMLREAGYPLFALRLCQDGTPSHPLYLREDTEPVPIGAACDPGAGGKG